jgi:hypothetical protein
MDSQLLRVFFNPIKFNKNLEYFSSLFTPPSIVVAAFRVDVLCVDKQLGTLVTSNSQSQEAELLLLI